MPALALVDVHTFIAGSHILQGVTFDVPSGLTTVLLGRNGAGKSTTLRSIMGLTPARDGRIEIFGQETTRWAPYRILDQWRHTYGGNLLIASRCDFLSGHPAMGNPRATAS